MKSISLLMFRYAIATSLLLSLTVSLHAQGSADKPLRIGIIGLDTSHVSAFTKILNSPDEKGDFAKMNVTAAFPGGSPDIASSRDRVEGFTKELKGMGVEICDSIETMITKVDAVLLESVDGRPHLKQAIPVLKAGLPLFIDKPLTASLADSLALHRYAKEKKGRWFSSSSLRFSSNTIKFRKDPAWQGKIMGAVAWSPCSLDPTHPDLFWYGIHGVETLYTAMGTGCKTVTRTFTKGTDVVTGVWADGRCGTFRGIREGKSDYGLVVFGKDKVETGGKYDGYRPLVEQIASFFLGGPAPVEAEETIELIAFMQAAQKSSDQGGIPVAIDDVMKEASVQADKILASLK